VVVRFTLSVVWIAALLGAVAVSPGRTMGDDTIAAAGATTSSVTVATVTEEHPGEDIEDVEVEGPFDLFGNEVNPAVAKYGYDSNGSLYEFHSPQTELPRLRSPEI
jgi:hypothetical protein